MEKKEIEVKEWRYIIPSGKGLGDIIKKTLARMLVGDEHCFDSVDSEFIEEQKFITAIPFELSLTLPERETIRRRNEAPAWVITGVREEDIEHLRLLGFRLLSKPIIPTIFVGEKEYPIVEVEKALRLWEEIKGGSK